MNSLQQTGLNCQNHQLCNNTSRDFFHSESIIEIYRCFTFFAGLWPSVKVTAGEPPVSYSEHTAMWYSVQCWSSTKTLRLAKHLFKDTPNDVSLSTIKCVILLGGKHLHRGTASCSVEQIASCAKVCLVARETLQYMLCSGGC